MNIEELRVYCINKKEVTESFPFDESTLVFKVAGKMFCLTDLIDDFALTLKNDPQKIIDLKEHYAAIKPGYHMNKNHWITVEVDGTISDHLLKQLIDDSYRSVIKSLPRAIQHKLNDNRS